MTREEMLTRLAQGEAPLALAIEKWQRIVAGTGEDKFGINCALCEVYASCVGCVGCPLKSCSSGSIYANWHRHQTMHHQSLLRALCPECRVLANAMVTKLIDLMDYEKEAEENGKSHTS